MTLVRCAVRVEASAMALKPGVRAAIISVAMSSLLAASSFIAWSRWIHAASGMRGLVLSARYAVFRPQRVEMTDHG